MSARKALLIRIDPALHDELMRWAAAELRSLNGHIEYLLRQAVAERAGRTDPDSGQQSDNARRD